MCQLRGCDRGGRASAAELALAGGIDVNVGRLFQPADFGVNPDPTGKLYSRANISQRIYLPGVINFTGGSGPQRRSPVKLPLYGHLTGFDVVPILQIPQSPNGQVAQLVERGPEKAGVGGSIPSLATIIFNNLQTAKKRVKISRANNTRTLVTSDFTFGVARSNNRASLLVLTYCYPI